MAPEQATAVPPRCSQRKALRRPVDNTHCAATEPRSPFPCQTCPRSPPSKTCASSPRSRVPRMFYDYADSGSLDRKHLPRQRERLPEDHAAPARGGQHGGPHARARTMVGQEVAMPVAIAPTGLTGMQHADGEILAARAAKALRHAVHALDHEHLLDRGRGRAHRRHPFWFQLYVMRDRDFIERLIDRAKAASCSALVLTLDLQILGQRHKDIKNGLSRAAQADAGQHHQHGDQAALVHGHAGHQAPHLRQHRRPRQGRQGHVARCRPGPPSSSTRRCRWDDVEWIKKRWGGKLILKGIHGRRGRAAGGGTAAPTR